MPSSSLVGPSSSIGYKLTPSSVIGHRFRLSSSTGYKHPDCICFPWAQQEAPCPPLQVLPAIRGGSPCLWPGRPLMSQVPWQWPRRHHMTSGKLAQGSADLLEVRKRLPPLGHNRTRSVAGDRASPVCTHTTIASDRLGWHCAVAWAGHEPNTHAYSLLQDATRPQWSPSRVSYALTIGRGMQIARPIHSLCIHMCTHSFIDSSIHSLTFWRKDSSWGHCPMVLRDSSRLVMSWGELKGPGGIRKGTQVSHKISCALAN